MRTSPTAARVVEPARHVASPNAAVVQAGPPIPKTATSRRSHSSTIRRTPAWATSERFVAASSTRPGRQEALGHAAERVGDPPERLAVRAGQPVAAAQRDDGRAGLARRLVERVGERRDRRSVADPDDRAVADRGPQHLRRRAGRPSAGRGPRGRGCSARGGPRRARSARAARRPRPMPGPRPVDDPDLDDALGPGALEQPRDLRPGDAEQLGDRATASRPARSRAGSRR